MGTRKSGDPNTTSGNSLLNIMGHAWALHQQNIEDYSMEVNGDDNVLYLKDEPDVEKLKDSFTQCGFKAGVEKKNVDNVSFCSGYFWPVKHKGERKWCFGPDPIRYL